MGHFYKYNNSEPLQSQAPKNQAFKICPEKNTFHPSKKQPIINIAISAACETEGKNAMLMMGVRESILHSISWKTLPSPVPQSPQSPAPAMQAPQIQPPRAQSEQPAAPREYRPPS